MYTPTRDVSEIRGIDPRNRQKKQTHIAHVLFATLSLLLAVAAVCFAFWCPATHSVKFLGGCTVPKEEQPIPSQATSTATDVDTDADRVHQEDGAGEGDDGYGGAASSLETGSGLTTGRNASHSDNGDGSDSDRTSDGSGTQTTIINNIYQTTDGGNQNNSSNRTGDTSNNNTESNDADDGDSVSLTFIRKQVDRIYEYVNERFDDIAQEFTTKILNVTENIQVAGSLTDQANSTGDVGDVLVSTGTGVEWMATSSLGFDFNHVGGSGPAGDNMQVQFNDNGDFGASSNFIWDKDRGELGVGTDDLRAVLTLQEGSYIEYDETPGENILTNGSFDTDADSWDLSCAEWNDGAVTLAQSEDCTDPELSTSLLTEANAVYELTFTLSDVTGGGVSIQIGDDGSGYIYSSPENLGNGTHTIQFTTPNDSYPLFFDVWSDDMDAAATIDTVAVQRVGVSSPADSDLLFAQNAAGQDLMRLTNTGWLALGSDNPEAVLHVKGTGAYNDISPQSIFTDWFDTNPADNDSWALGDCASWDSNDVTIEYTACSEPTIGVTFPVDAGATYELEFTLSDVAADGEARVLFEGGLDGGAVTAYGAGTHQVTFTADSSGMATLRFAFFDEESASLSNSSFTIDNVFIRQTGEYDSDPTILVENGGGERMLYLGENGFDTVSIGRNAGDGAEEGNYIGAFAGYNALTSTNVNFLGNYAGRNVENADNAIFIGNNAGDSAYNAGGTIFLGDQAGSGATDYTDSIFIGTNAGYNDAMQFFPCGECGIDPSILIGAFTSTGGYSGSIALGAYTTNTASNQFKVGGIDEMVLSDGEDGPFFYANTKGVGIGTTTPGSKLTVVGGNITQVAGGDVSEKGNISLNDSLDVFVAGTYAYIADGTAGLSIVDVSNPDTPVSIGSYNTSGTAQGVYVSGTYAYIADGTAGLQVIDISTPSAPTLVGTYATNDSTHDVYVSGKYAYLADGAEGLSVIDVSDPTTPVLAGSYNSSGTGLGIYISGNYAYLADGADGLAIINIANPATPSLAGASTGFSGGTAEGIYISGKYAYLADGDEGLRILDVSDPTSPALLSTVTEAYGAHDVYVSGKYAYVGSYTFSIIDVTDPASPNIVSETYSIYSLTGIHVAGKYAYASDSGRGLQIFDINGIDTPSLYAGSIQSDILSVTGNIFAGGDMYVQGGLTAGPLGIFSNGGVSANGTSTFLGSLGLGTTTPSAQLTTTGTVRFAGFGAGSLQTDSLGNVTVSSDERLKNKQSDFTRGIADIVKLQPISYTWKAETGYDTATIYTGFSAQNVQDAIPEAVATDSKGYLTLSDRPILAAVVNALKEIWEKITGQDERIDALESRIRELEAREGIEQGVSEEEETDITTEEDSTPDEQESEDLTTVEEEPTEPLEGPVDESEETTPETESVATTSEETH